MFRGARYPGRLPSLRARAEDAAEFGSFVDCEAGMLPALGRLYKNAAHDATTATTFTPRRAMPAPYVLRGR